MGIECYIHILYIHCFLNMYIYYIPTTDYGYNGYIYSNNHYLMVIYIYTYMLYVITKGSSRGATLSFTLRSKGEGGQPCYLILQEIASHFSTPPSPPPHLPRTLRADSKHCNLQYFCSFRIKKPHFATW